MTFPCHLYISTFHTGASYHLSCVSLNFTNSSVNPFANAETIDRNRPLTLGDIIDIIQPLEKRMAFIEASVQKIAMLENKVQLLETEYQAEVVKNKILTDTVVNMQKSLNKIDSETRATNLIISGLKEGAMKIDDDTTLQDDLRKFHHLLGKIDLGTIPWDIVSGFEVERIGKENERFTSRLLKVNVKDNKYYTGKHHKGSKKAEET